jgi:hypothetical protein
MFGALRYYHALWQCGTWLVAVVFVYVPLHLQVIRNFEDSLSKTKKAQQIIFWIRIFLTDLSQECPQNSRYQIQISHKEGSQSNWNSILWISFSLHLSTLTVMYISHQHISSEIKSWSNQTSRSDEDSKTLLQLPRKCLCLHSIRNDFWWFELNMTPMMPWYRFQRDFFNSFLAIKNTYLVNKCCTCLLQNVLFLTRYYH